MSKMYIVNCTSQNQVICYQLPGTAKVVQQTIGMGRQDFVGGSFADFSPPEIESIATQLRPYGLIAAADVKRLPGKIVPYIWSESVIKLGVIKHVMDHNKGVHVVTGEKRRENAALGTNDALKKIIETAVQEGQPVPPVDTFTIEVEEVDTESSAKAHEDLGTKPIAKGFEIDNKSSAGPPRGGRGKNRGQRAA